MVANKNRFTLSKTFRFEAAHRIAKGYEGKCKHIHGHSWNGLITVSCLQVDRFGMGVDFGIIKQFLKQIEDYFDHKLILYKEDTALIKVCQQQGWDVVVFDDDNPKEILRWESESNKAYCERCIFILRYGYFPFYTPCIAMPLNHI